MHLLRRLRHDNNVTRLLKRATKHSKREILSEIVEFQVENRRESISTTTGYNINDADGNLTREDGRAGCGFRKTGHGSASIHHLTLYWLDKAEPADRQR